MKDEILALSTRRRIYHFIKGFPGTYLREILRELKLSIGVLQYHLRYLEENEIIVAQSDGYRKRYYIKEDVPFPERSVLTLLKLRTPRRIVVYLLLHPNATFREILTQFNFTKGALSFHLSKLLKAELITQAKREYRNTYAVTNADEVARILITYKHTFVDGIVDSFVDAWTRI